MAYSSSFSANKLESFRERFGTPTGLVSTVDHKVNFHVLDNPDILCRLREELIDAIPDPANLPRLSEPGKLPYLTAVIQEGGTPCHVHLPL